MAHLPVSRSRLDWLNVLAGVSFVLFLACGLTVLVALTAGIRFGNRGMGGAGWDVAVFDSIYLDHITDTVAPPANSPLWTRGLNGRHFCGITFQQSVRESWKDQSTVMPGRFSHHTELWVHVAWPMLATLALPFVWFVKRWTAARRIKGLVRTGLCPFCGYDLRASNLQCPECGRPKPTANPLVPRLAPNWVVVMLVTAAAMSIPLVLWLVLMILTFWNFQSPG